MNTPVHSLRSLGKEKKYVRVQMAFIAIFSVVIGFVIGWLSNSQSTPKRDTSEVLSRAQSTSMAIPTAIPVLDCEYASPWFGFYFQYRLAKEYTGTSCNVTYYEITDSCWSQLPNGMTIFPRNNLSDKAWWRTYIHDEAGFLPESTYDFTFATTKNGVHSMYVTIDNAKVTFEKDGVDAGPERGSFYYFGDRWVLREKVFSTGGPNANFELFESTLKLIPIQNTRDH